MTFGLDAYEERGDTENRGGTHPRDDDLGILMM